MIEILLLVLFGVLIGISLGAVGAGGSILAVPVLVYVAGEAPKQATASALVVVLITSLIALRPHWAARRVRLDLAAPFAVTGSAGAVAGKLLAEGMNSDVLMLCFSGVMVTSALLMARRERAASAGAADAGPIAPFVDVTQGGLAMLAPTTPDTQRATGAGVSLKALGVGALVGVMTGFFGVGGGFVIVPALVLILGVPMTEAVGTSLVIIAVNSLVAFALKSRGVHLDTNVIATFAVAAAAGALLGGGVARKVDAKSLTGWFVKGVLAVAVYTAVRSILALA